MFLDVRKNLSEACLGGAGKIEYVTLVAACFSFVVVSSFLVGFTPGEWAFQEVVELGVEGVCNDLEDCFCWQTLRFRHRDASLSSSQ